MSWLTGWTYQKSVPLSHASGALTNYQMKLTVGESSGSAANDVHCEGHCASNFQDLRFTTSDGTTLLHYKIESISGTTPNQVAKIFIKFDSIGTGATTFYMYYGNASLNTDPVNAPLDYQWKKYASNPVLVVGTAGAWDDFWVQFHSIVKDGSTYYAYYNGNRSGTRVQVGLATSSDGITWTKSGSNPVLAFGAAGKWDDAVVGATCVWKEGSTWYMLYNGARATGNASIGLATSTDGIAWTRYDVDNPVMTCAAGWSSAFIGPGQTMLKEGSTYYLYYTGGTSTSDTTTFKIGVATSTDLHTWTPSANNPLITNAGASPENCSMEPCVLKFGSTYYMWYQATYVAGDVSRIFLATSANPDGPFTKSANNPVHTRGFLGAWDVSWVEAPIVIQVGTEWRLYYGGSGGSAATPRMQVGYAIYTFDGGTGTFDLYDNFDGGSSWDLLWTTNGTPTEASSVLTLNSAQEGIKSVATFQYKKLRMKLNFPVNANASYRNWAGFGNVLDQSNVEMATITPVGGATTNIYNANYLSAYDSGSLGAYTGDQIFQINRYSNAVDDYLDAASLRHDTTTNTIPTSALSVKFMAAISSNYYAAFTVDWVCVMNNDPTEPAWGTWGAEAQVTIQVYKDAASLAEFLAALDADKAGPFELLKSLNRDASSPLSFFKALGKDASSPAEFLGGLSKDAISPVEFLKGLSKDAAIPSEWLGSLSADKQSPMEFLKALAKDSEIPVEWIETLLATVTKDAISPLEWISALRTDKQMAIESLKGLSEDAESPVEWLQALFSSKVFAMDFLAFLTGDFRIPLEIVAYYAANAVRGVGDFSYQVLQLQERRGSEGSFFYEHLSERKGS